MAVPVEISGPDQLLAALTKIATVDPVSLPPAQAREELLTLVRASHALQAVVAVRVDAFDRARGAIADGLRTTKAWLRGFARLSLGAATGLLSRGRLYRLLPAVAEQAQAGAISPEHADRIHHLCGTLGVSRLAPMDSFLAEMAAATDPAGMAEVCGHIHDAIDPDHATPDPRRDFDNRGLTLARQGAMLALRGRLDPEGGAALQTALDALMRPPTIEDTRTAQQRRADALVELARLPLNDGVLPTVGGQRPHLAVLITPQTLIGDDLPPRPAPTTPPTAAEAWDGVIPDRIPPEWATEAWVVQERPDTDADNDSYYADYLDRIDLDDLDDLDDDWVDTDRDVDWHVADPADPDRGAAASSGEVTSATRKGCVPGARAHRAARPARAGPSELDRCRASRVGPPDRVRR